MAILPTKLQELGRIRIGDKVEAKNQKGETIMRPHKLNQFRLTSANKPRLEYAASIYGGTVQRWEGSPNEGMWELYTEADSLSVTLPPFSAFSQQNEIWQGGECRLRCDGEHITFSLKEESVGKECQCGLMALKERLEKEKKGLACATITRVNLILPDLPGAGVWRFETKSFYAGMELQGSATMLEAASAQGVYIECTLQIEERRVTRRNDKGKMQTQVFPVVTLQPNVSMRQLLSMQIPDEALIGGPPTPMMISAPEAQETISDVWGQRETPEPPKVDPEPSSEASGGEAHIPSPGTKRHFEMKIQGLCNELGIDFGQHQAAQVLSAGVEWDKMTVKQYDAIIAELNALKAAEQAEEEPKLV